MGRPTFFRQRILNQASSLESKGLLNYLISEIKSRREVSLEEAVLIARDVQHYLKTEHLTRSGGQIIFPCISGRDTYQKRSRQHQDEKEIALNVIDEEDIELMAEFGISVMQKGRLSRLIEEAYFQDAILDGLRCLLFILESHRGIRSHLKHFWQQGVLLPIAGMNTQNRRLMQELRPVLAIRQYLEGKELYQLRKDLAISTGHWQKLWHDFKELGNTNNLVELEQQTGQPLEVLSAWQELFEQHQQTLMERVRETKNTCGKSFYQLLCTRHGYSPAAADQFIEDLHELAAHLNRRGPKNNQIIYNAVSDREPAGKKLSECQLKAVAIDYIDPEDLELVDRESAKKLRWARILRYATRARYHGAVLTQPDLSLLLGISTEAIQTLLKEHPDVIVPTRGMVADMGPALSHADKIINLFMNGYTETEIVRRTGHSYESVENYTLSYAKVVYLLQKGMPAPAIRKALGFSRKLVDKYINLYREYSGPDYSFMFGKLRRLAEARPVKKKEGGMKILQAKKGISQRYKTLLVRETTAVQRAHLKKEFELAEASRVAEAACALTAKDIQDYEENRDTKRLSPGELLLEVESQKIILPFINENALTQLKEGTCHRAVQRELEQCQFEQLKKAAPEANMEDLWQLVNQGELPLKRGGKDFLPEQKLDAAKVEPPGRQSFQGEIPLEALAPAISSLVDDWGLRPSQAEAMANAAARIYTWCAPLSAELKPGQMVWLAHGTKKSRRTDPALFQPVVLTLLTPEEQALPFATTADLKRLKTIQLERLTTEAWKQDAVLTTLDMEWILNISPSKLRGILEAYFEQFGIILPTAGTVLDMGRTLSHKKIVVQLSLEGLSTQEISQRIYHTPEAVDNYLRLFERVLLLKYYRVPVSALPRVTGYGRSLLQEHLDLVDKHFPTEETLTEYLGQRGVKLEKISSGN